jgi:hypothetical protein
MKTPLVSEVRFEWACRIARVRFVGIQCGYGVRPDAMLFQPLFGVLRNTTLAVDADRATPISISYRICDALNELREEEASRPRQVA